ncbi:MAG TPA: phosphoglucosamine mutase [Pyrinomonadaceae bacterium]|jgi:phosphoglucosamine mutase|nr:phosphoglucosamine mutase [Pyrinomonadaceae bacterium]
MKSLFGTDGIRGEAGKFPLDAPTVNLIGASLARYLKSVSSESPLIIIGRDTRESGDWLESSLFEGASNAGATCLSAGVITTPGVAYLTRDLQADAGVVISASHNPFHDNGIKIFAQSGKKIPDEVERYIEAEIIANQQSTAAVTSNALRESFLTEDELRNRYLKFLCDNIGAGLNLSGIKIVVDCANGASSALAPHLFETLGASVVAINASPNGRNINLNCGSLHIESLQSRVVAENANLGIAFDGDADRALFVDEIGNIVDGDATLWVLTNQLLRQNRLKSNIVVATVMSNIGLEIALRSRGIELVRTDVGDKYVLEELLKRDASLGGEQSGHIILSEVSLAGDGMITSLCLLRSIAESRQSLSELTAELSHYPQVLINVRVREKVDFERLSTVQEAVAEVKERLSHNGRLILRYSGTEPLARVMIEGADQHEIEKYAEEIAGRIRSEIGV